MENRGSCGGGGWWVYAIPLFTNGGYGYFLQSSDDVSLWRQWPVYVALLIAAICVVVVAWLIPGGCAWAGRHKRREKVVVIPGPKGWPIIRSMMDMSMGFSHCKLEALSLVHGAKKLMAFSLGSTPVVVTCDMVVDREFLSSPHLANRPLKQSTQRPGSY